MIVLSDDYRVRPLDHLQWILERKAETGAGPSARSSIQSCSAWCSKERTLRRRNVSNARETTPLLLQVELAGGPGRLKHQDRHLKHDGARSERWLPVAYCRPRAGLETALSRLRCQGIHLDAGELCGRLGDEVDQAAW
jgi:hypothetical protein